MHKFDLIIIGAGAAGLMAAATAGYRGKNVLLIDKNKKAGSKILISGGGRCNFTNRHADPRKHYLSQNPHFCISAMKRYSADDFIELVDRHGIEHYEKTLGQLFCKRSSKEILKMLLDECEWAEVKLNLGCDIAKVSKEDDVFSVVTDQGTFHSDSLFIATGGPSLPKIGGSHFSYQIAEQFGINVIEPRPALVPLTWMPADETKYVSLAGIALPCRVHCDEASFDESFLFTHRGLSGPAILQISSFWKEGKTVELDFFPDQNLMELLLETKKSQPKSDVKSFFLKRFPKRVVELWEGTHFINKPFAQLSNKELDSMVDHFQNWKWKPNGTEGYRTAEVTLGGIDTDELSSKTMESKKVSGLYFIGEAVDVTGWLGGYNFQWAWSSAYAAGESV